jgi:glutamate-5-semialdehyde dehydrogenase
MTTKEILIAAKALCPAASSLSNEQIDCALYHMAQQLNEQSKSILIANEKDLTAARGHLSDAMIDRLTLTEARIDSMANGILAVRALPSPLHKTLARRRLASGVQLRKISVPMGVVAIIYESRPNVTSDAAALALKSGNVCILRSGRDAFESANAIVSALQTGLESAGLAREFVQLVQDTDRKSATELMTAVGYVDLLIPRGGGGLINACLENAKVPCIQTGMGICHIYADKSADIDLALNVIENAKTSRPSVCNAQEVLLVHRDLAKEFLPRLKERLVDERQKAGKVPVELRLDERACTYISGKAASDTDFDTEFLDYILAIKIVDSVDEAIAHINAHSTHHSEAILTRSQKNANRFCAQIDSAALYVNASTRFTDGGEFGLGCEMGISTQKLHARGPMGLCELTTYKYILRGNGQVR